ncbi:DUF4105 domain-containing protein [Undibacterium cyanobacteriorum]|uniref:DUF4105 domain-containing protein n=1 Tax=Undibacterium cyanobacteriorum TaxID=3073561 RepID=A0ABY9RHM6_9BURK|nr:DUF4105 domain-containing protein [Undibacterium sp. 20NA77.5]WMW80169.1 DUF4105 domain-containing protein [Undibacterium sp. 20NA77.5]
MQISASHQARKGGYLAAFFSILILFFTSTQSAQASEADELNSISAYQQKAHQLALAKSPMWSALLHADQGGFHITSSKFLLSADTPELERELNLTIAWLMSGEAGAVCRYPARYLWLREALAIPEQALESCDELQEFLTRAPAERVDLVFAAENITQASSMMGHVFLKLSGKSSMGQSTEHAVSFFTDAAGYNLPKLFFDSMVIGKLGYFSLSPYSEKLQLYVGEEQRSVWEYELRFSAAQRRLLQAHLIELKQAKLTYFFQKYNCATLLDFVIAVAAGKSLDKSGFWVTPKDVVKRAYALNLIESSRVHAPNQWLLRAYQTGLTASQVEHVAEAVKQQQSISFTAPISDAAKAQMLALADTYAAYLTDRELLKGPEVAAYRQSLRENRRQLPSPEFQFESLKDPANSPQDSQWDLGLTRQGKANNLRFVINPASHHLSDDNRTYNTESDLRVFETSLLVGLDRRSLQLERMTVYSSQLLMPYDGLTRTWSNAVLVELARQPKQDGGNALRWQLGAGRGLSWRVFDDIDIAAMLNGGLSNRSDQWRLYLEPQVTMVVRSLFDSKMIVRLSQVSNLERDQQALSRVQWEQVKYFDGQTWSLHFAWKRERMTGFSRSQWDLFVRRFF